MLRTIKQRDKTHSSYCGYLFWSIFQGIGPMIWFFPMNLLKISGYEILVLFSFTPVLMIIPGLLSLVQRRSVLSVLRLCLAVSLTSFQSANSTTRVYALSYGTSVNSLILCATLWSKSNKQRSLSHWGLMLGFVALQVSRVWFTSFMPPFWSHYTNNICFTLALIATIDKIISGDDKLHLTGDDTRSSKHRDTSRDHTSPSKNAVKPSALITGLTFGCVLYVMHAVFSDVHVLTRWSNYNYPQPGPLPYPWGACVLLCCVCGLLLPITAVTSVCWWLLGSGAFIALYLLRRWPAYIGGLLLAVYTFSLWRSVCEKLSRCPAALTLTLSLLTYFSCMFYSVWTTAYNFVPLGEYTREHTGYLIAFILIVQLLSFISNRRQQFSPSNHTSRRAKQLLILLLITGFAGFYSRLDKNQKIGSNAKVMGVEKREFTALIWTFHFGMDNQGWPSMERAAQVINDTDADFITLLESDASKPYHGNHDPVMWMGERLKMYSDFGPSTKDHTWGNAVLSRYPIVTSQHHLLPSPEGELAPAVSVTVNISGSLVDFVVTHMGNEDDTLDRELQAKYLANLTKAAVNPVVFLGYLTSSPYSRDYTMISENGNMKDIDINDNTRWCEYIMYRGLIRLSYGRITAGGLSDTELQLAKFRIPPDPNNYRDHDKVVTNIKADLAQVPEDQFFHLRFGEYYIGHGVLGHEQHQFHMATPKYFLPIPRPDEEEDEDGWEFVEGTESEKSESTESKEKTKTETGESKETAGSVNDDAEKSSEKTKTETGESKETAGVVNDEAQKSSESKSREEKNSHETGKSTISAGSVKEDVSVESRKETVKQVHHESSSHQKVEVKEKVTVRSSTQEVKIEHSKQEKKTESSSDTKSSKGRSKK